MIISVSHIIDIAVFSDFAPGIRRLLRTLLSISMSQSSHLDLP